jgi:hypothetical protein
MERQAVQSRDLAIVGYDSDSSTLEVTFRNGGVYHYSGVPQELYQGLLQASSLGTFFNEKIKDSYPFKRIR